MDHDGQGEADLAAEAVTDAATNATADATADAPDTKSPKERAAWVMTLLEGARELAINPACDFKPEPVNWLWPARIPRGQITLLAGDPGSGKSLVALDLAARVSRGAGWPDNPNQRHEPENVLMLTAHTDPHVIGTPRLERAGADLSRVFFATGILRREFGLHAWKRPVSLPDDLKALAKAIITRRPMSLVVIDPAWAFCRRGRGRSRLAGPALLAELAELAFLTRVAIVCVTDLRRDAPGGTGYRAAGDRALLAAAPTAWGLVRDPQQPQRRVMLPLKANISPEQQQGLAFRIDEGRIEWQSEPTTISGAALLAAEGSRGEPAAVDAWLQAFLAQGPQPAKEVIRQGRECGFSPWMLRRARLSLGASVDKCGYNGDAHWKWSLAGVAMTHAETNGARATSRIFDDCTASSSDSGVFCEDAEIAGAASSMEDSQHLRVNSADLSKM